MSDTANWGEPGTKQPLYGVRVVDVGVLAAAPLAATLLGDFGADVIKVELPCQGDPVRQMGPSHKGTPLWWAVLDRNKRSMTLDLRLAKGQEVFKRLVSVSDIVIENFLPGTLEEWGLGYEALHKVNRGIILVRVSGFGQEGPYSRRPLYDRAAQAIGGLVHVTGYPNMPPVRAGLPVVDDTTAIVAAFGALLALHHRSMGGGEGQVVDCALYESMLVMLDWDIAAYDKLGLVRERQGNVHPAVAPGDLFKTQDNRWVLISAVSDQAFQRLAKVIGHEELLSDPRFRTIPQRVQHTELLNATVAEWVAQHTLRDAVETLARQGVVVGPVYTVKDIVEDEHFRERGSVLEVEHPAIGTLKMQGVIPRLSLTPGSVKSPGPALGEHTREILSDLLGYTEQEIEDLKAGNVI